jgi:acetoin utilization deacetylase AcuC-like enzyme
MGFCLLNNVAIAATHLIKEEQARRLAIVDLDLHHGNGTQEIFWERRDVLYVSTHQFPFYPGTGRLEETGAGEGAGATLNVPLPALAGDEAFVTVLEELILPVLERFGPEMVLVSVGFDTHWRDPLGQLQLTAEVYGDLIRKLQGFTEDRCQGRLALFLEGGYDLEAGAACAQAVVSAMMGLGWQDPLGPPRQRESTAWRETLAKGKRLWDL